ncbi:hypothetical protein EQM14_01160 [Caproiciproducens sp. NJN-50]|uniref:hypothetical protein n=1 Tax=Acutalibacteraceae TaxID=3082771 RepID=UPI000FFE0D70|nr:MULTISPECIES: hypothetical protein [Acutalibacteraceae]QAT48495.1 hypothetical protein EQM14_01160 [Caproiciproducens sp. NJN-50]
MKKKIFALILAVSMVFSAGVPAFASEKTKATTSTTDSGIHIMWTNTDIATANVNFYGDRAECTSTIHGKDGTSKITATALLKRVNSNGTTTVKAWTGLSASGANFYFDKSYYVSSGYTYIFEINAQVYRNGTVEYITESDSDYCG